MNIKDRLNNQIKDTNGVIEPLAIRNTFPVIAKNSTTPVEHILVGSVGCDEITTKESQGLSTRKEETFADRGVSDVRKISQSMPSEMKTAIFAMSPATDSYETSGYRSKGTGYYFGYNDYGVDSLAFGDMTKRVT